jgi:hypothetical protein
MSDRLKMMRYRYPSIAQTLSNRCPPNCFAIALKKHFDRCAITARSRGNRSVIVVQSLRDRSELRSYRCAITARSVGNRFVIVAQSMRDRLELLSNHRAITTQSLGFCCAFLWKLLCDRFAIAHIVSEIFQNRSVINPKYIAIIA